MPSGLAERLEIAYYRYGPGRLPGADRRDVGGGYAFATVMLVFAAVFLLNQSVGLGLGNPWPAVLETPRGYATTVALVAACGFVAGFLTWRYLDGRLPYFPLSCGLAASLLTHLLVVLVLDIVVNARIGHLTASEKFVGVFVAYPGFVYVVTRELLAAFMGLHVFGMVGGYGYETLPGSPDS